MPNGCRIPEDQGDRVRTAFRCSFREQTVVRKDPVAARADPPLLLREMQCIQARDVQQRTS